MCLNQTLMQIRDLERENRDLRSELQQNLLQENKRFKKSGDIVIKKIFQLQSCYEFELSDAFFFMFNG
jgi:hypothetical protein